VAAYVRMLADFKSQLYVILTPLKVSRSYLDVSLKLRHLKRKQATWFAVIMVETNVKGIFRERQKVQYTSNCSEKQEWYDNQARKDVDTKSNNFPLNINGIFY
jgi:hypothetical protein